MGQIGPEASSAQRVDVAAFVSRVGAVAFDTPPEAAAVDPDFHVRLAAIDHRQALQLRDDDMIPRRESLKNLDVAPDREISSHLIARIPHP